MLAYTKKKTHVLEWGERRITGRWVGELRREESSEVVSSQWEVASSEWEVASSEWEVASS
jgi:hypothetical protein